VSHLQSRCAKLLLSCLFCKNGCLYCTMRIVVGFSYIHKNIVSILGVYARIFLVSLCMVLWCLHRKGGGILVDCSLKILVSKL